MPELIACPIWRSSAYLIGGSLNSGARVQSPRAGGIYRITREAIEDHSDLSLQQMLTLTTWIVDQKRFGVPEPELTTEIVAAVVKSRRVLTFSESRQRFFECMARFQMRPGDEFQIEAGPAWLPDQERHPDELYAWMGVANPTEARGMDGLLREQGFVLSHAGASKALTAKGFEELDQISRGGPETRQAFVAMWFADEMKEAWRVGFAPAIRDAGYDPFRIDNLEHNGKIDDAIVAEIKKSRFLIADFTCGVNDVRGKSKAEPRGGVYYEAGLAHGLGMQVIFTCRADRMEFLHFDTRQFAHIVWKSPVDLRTQLYNRIAATVKEAPGAPGRGNGNVDPNPGPPKSAVD